MVCDANENEALYIMKTFRSNIFHSLRQIVLKQIACIKKNIFYG